MSWQLLTVLAGGIATLGIYSFFIRENVVYRFFEHLFIGIAAGLIPVVTIQTYFWPKVIVPMFGLDIITFPDGTVSQEYNPLYLLLLLPAAFGLLYYFIYSTKYSWLAKLVIGFSLGAAGGLAFKGFANQALPQIFSSFKPLVVFDPSGEFSLFASFNNIVFVFTLLSVMYYFFFSYRRKGKGSQAVSASGRWLMMVCFGAFFGSTVMARLALLIERVEFLLRDFASAIGGFFV